MDGDFLLLAVGCGIGAIVAGAFVLFYDRREIRHLARELAAMRHLRDLWREEAQRGRTVGQSDGGQSATEAGEEFPDWLHELAEADRDPADWWKRAGGAEVGKGEIP